MPRLSGGKISRDCQFGIRKMAEPVFTAPPTYLEAG
jgi:hypothetical protein